MQIETLIHLQSRQNQKLQNDLSCLINVARSALTEKVAGGEEVFARPVRRIRGNQFSLSDVNWLLEKSHDEAAHLRSEAGDLENCPFPPLVTPGGADGDYVAETWRDGQLAAASRIERLTESIVEAFADKGLSVQRQFLKDSPAPGSKVIVMAAR